MSHGHDLDVNAGGERERFEVIGIGGQNRVSVGRKQDHGSVDHVGSTRTSEQDPRATSESLVERDDFDRGEKLGKTRLTSAATPDLSDHSTVRAWSPKRCQLGSDNGVRERIASLDGDERACIQDDAHRP
ncbi:MAG TPA: hypothetical protein VGM39_24345 [Kofleriaceae bacterium]|jgi:hypothetical protein